MLEGFVHFRGNVSADDYNRRMGPALCTTANCRIPLTFRRAHERMVRREPIQVRPHFIVDGGRAHTDSCPFNLPARALKICKRSTPFDGHEAIMSEEDGRVSFHVRILADTLSQMEAGEIPKPSTRRFGDREVKYSGIGVQSFYLRRAKAVLALSQRLDQNTTMRDLIDIRSGTETLPWDSFLFRERVESLVNAVEDNPELPRATSFTMLRQFPATEARPTWLVSGVVDNINGAEYCLNLRGNLDAIFRRIVENRASLICGIPRVRRRQGVVYVDYWIGNINQVCKIP